MRWRLWSGVRVLVVALLIGCGSEEAALPDAPPPTCELALQVAPGELSDTPPARVRVDAIVRGPLGVDEVRWQVARDDAHVVVTPLTDDGRAMQFTSDVAGYYRVTAQLFAPTVCASAVAHLNVKAAAAPTQRVRLRITPATADAGTAVETEVAASQGVSYFAGTVALPVAKVIEGRVTVDGAPVAAQLFFTPVAGGRPLVTASDARGAFQTAVGVQAYAVSVVPASMLVAPWLVPQWLAPDNGARAELVAPPSVRVTGVVSVNGVAMADVQVQVAQGKQLSTLTRTDATGQFAVALRSAAAGAEPLTVTVAPHDATIRWTATIMCPVGEQIAVRLQPPARQGLAPRLMRSTTAPLADATVIATANLANVGELHCGTATPQPIAMHAVWHARTDASGRMANLDGVAAPVTLLARHASGVWRYEAAVGSGTQALMPAPARLLTLGPWTREPASNALPWRLSIAPAATPQQNLEIRSDATGRVAIAVPRELALVLVAREPGHALAAQPVILPSAAGDLTLAGPLATPAQWHGRVLRASDGAPAVGATVEAFCVACGAALAEIPLAVGVVDAFGGYRLGLPAPLAADALRRSLKSHDATLRRDLRTAIGCQACE